MKKSIKVLSAIFAILLLSMTLTVPVTAVESEVEVKPLYILGYETLYVYTDISNDTVLYSGTAMLTYRRNTNLAYMSLSASLGSTIYDFQDFGVDLDGYVNCVSGYNDRTPRGEDYGDSVHDIAELHFEPDVSSDCISIASSNALLLGPSLSMVADVHFVAIEGEDFVY